MKFKGFTLIEVLTAISVMIIGILGIYALVPRMIYVRAINTDRFIASQLAREGIEIVRNIRDSNWLHPGLNWDNGLRHCENGCEADYNDTVLTSFADRFLRIDTLTGFYNYDPPSQTNLKTKFKRKIIITPGTDTLNVKVQITWGGKGSPFEVEENLYNWR